jgi:hypothetical protein
LVTERSGIGAINNDFVRHSFLNFIYPFDEIANENTNCPFMIASRHHFLANLQVLAVAYVI